MILSVVGIVRDGSVPAADLELLVPTVQELRIPRGEDTTIKLAVKRASGVAQDISAGTIKMGIRKFRHSTAVGEVITKLATTTNAPGGLADIVLTSADLLGLIEQFEYLWDIQWTDGASKRWQLVLASPLKVLGIVNRPTD